MNLSQPRTLGKQMTLSWKFKGPRGEARILGEKYCWPKKLSHQKKNPKLFLPKFPKFPLKTISLKFNLNATIRIIKYIFDFLLFHSADRLLIQNLDLLTLHSEVICDLNLYQDHQFPRYPLWFLDILLFRFNVNIYFFTMYYRLSDITMGQTQDVSSLAMKQCSTSSATGVVTCFNMSSP